MSIFKMGFVPIVLAAIIAGGVLVAGGGTYIGVTNYQSKNLIKEGDKLVSSGNYTEALTKYEKAKKKWRWVKIDTKKASAEELKQEREKADLGESHFGKGEWQKCMEILGQVTAKFPNYDSVRSRYSDCEKKLTEQVAAEATPVAVQPAPNTTSGKTTARSSNGTAASSQQSNSSSNSSSSSTNESSGESAPAPTLYLPYSTSSNLPDMMTPMGETIYHPDPPNPGGHPGIDYQWSNPATVPTIIASMDGTVSAIINNTNHSGTFDVMTINGRWGVDYSELGSVRDGLKVGDIVKVGDVIGTPQHPSSITDQPNFRMIHWQFGYSNGASGVSTRLCPLSYFASSAKSAIESLWVNTNAPELKANAPDICSGKYR